MRKYRRTTWAIFAFNLLMLIWLIAGLANSTRATCGSALNAQTCATATDVGRTAGVAVLALFWIAGDVVLGLFWLVTK